MTVALYRAGENDHPLSKEWGKNQHSAAPSSSSPASKNEAKRDSNVVDDDDTADFDDPLSMMLRGELDPLSAMMSGASSSTPASSPSSAAASSSSASASSSSAAAASSSSAAESPVKSLWDTKKREILKTCTLVGRISVAKIDLTKVGSGDVDLQHATSLASANERLRMLEKKVARSESSAGTSAGASASVQTFSQEEYVENLNKMKNQITVAWNTNQRVTSLKKAIMCAKMLADTRVPHFYPSMFVLVSEVLDAFCELVRQRLTGRHEDFAQKYGLAKKLPANFTPDDVATEAKETCRNWFFKIACIRELLPRILIEACLIPNYRFLTTSEYARVVSRLAHCTRGIGDPTVAVYARLYIASVASKVLGRRGATPIAPVVSMFDDYLFTFREFREEKVRKLALANGTTMEKYVALHGYAIEFILRFAGTLDTKTSQALLKRFNKSCRHLNVLKHVLGVLEPTFCAKNALNLVALVRDVETGAEAEGNRALALAALGERLCIVPPPEKQRLSVLNESWKMIKIEKDFSRYARCVKVFMELLVKFYTEREVRILLKDLLKHANATSGDELDDAESDLHGIIDVLMTYAERRGLGHLLTSQHFMQVVDIFKGDKKASLCKTLLGKFVAGGDEKKKRRRRRKKTKKKSGDSDDDSDDDSDGDGDSENAPSKHSDPVVIHTVFDLARYLHDSIDYLSMDAERAEIADLVCSFVERIDFGRNFEQQLSVYVDCRAGFANLDRVNVRLVLCAARLAMKTHRIVRGRHTKKTSAFVKACMAFCHITVPTVESAFTRMRLFCLCGQTALVNQAIPQAETCFEECVALVASAPASALDKFGRSISSEPEVYDICRSLLSSLVVVPGHPTKGPLHLVQKFLTAVADWTGWRAESGYRAALYVETIGLFHALGQRKLPYRVAHVLSNDELYGNSNRKYVERIDMYLKKLVSEDVQSELASLLGEDKILSPVGTVAALKLLNQMIACIELSKTTLKLAKRLVTLAAKGRRVKPSRNAKSADADGACGVLGVRDSDALLRNTADHVDRLARSAFLNKANDGAALEDLQRHVQSELANRA
eukprot:g1700.t1